MKSFLGITIVGSVLILGLAAFAANRSLRLLPSRAALAPAQAECTCRDLKTLRIELSNALLLQQAFSNKIAELRAMEMDARVSSSELKRWAESDARKGLKEVPGSSGPAQVDYKPWGDKLNYQDDERVTSKFTNEELCRRSDESAAALEEAKKQSACAGIAQAIQVHEDWHLNFCRTIGYRPYWLGMRGADRAKEEVEAYGAQIAVLHAEIAKLLDKNCEPYKASGQDGPTSYSGTICSLDKEFTVVGHNGPLELTFKFTPSGDGRAGTGTLGGSVSLAAWTGNGPYTIEGFDSEKPKIVWVTQQTVSGKISGSGTFHIDLVPLGKGETCKP
jgi:hypothetical protein